ncbi:MAG TPA: hypothetical protein VGO09_10180, partial [Flavisolibacter sp.]|nr:hypothetical protein [Flavisolibacter sp.]
MKKQVACFLLASAQLILFSFCFEHASSQTVDSAIAKYATHSQQERAYIHFDKSSYYSGETVWFKVYLMSGLFPADESKTFYIDWVTDNGEVLYHSVSPLVEATTNGQFEIPAEYNGNFVHVRAYTKWMLNFDTSFIYRKDIRILSRNVGQKIQRPAIIPSIQFFPEGGDAVYGIMNKVAFKAADQWGRPVRIKGTIVTGKGELIDSLRVRHDGMGYFSFIPQPGTAYLSKWKDEKGNDHTTELPSIKASGLTMQIARNGTKCFIKLNVSPDAPTGLRNLHITGTMNQVVAFKADARLAQDGSIQKVVPTQSLPSGILIITVFDAEWNAIAERITFINNHDYSFQPAMEVTHWGLNRRARNEVQLTLPDSISSASFSISVTDAAIERDTTYNIISHLLLSSDIKGDIYNPAYYFSNNSDSLVQNLDLVMLTHGWRRFKWEDVLKGKAPVIRYPRDTSYLTLSGQVFGVAKTQLSGNDNIVLMLKGKDSSNKMLIMPITRNGTFGDPTMVFFDTLHVYYHLKSKFFGNAEAKFMTDRLPADNYKLASRFFNKGEYPGADTSGLYHHGLLAGEALRLYEASKGKVMETITVTAKKKSTLQVLDEKYASGMFKAGDGYQFDLVSDPSSNAYPNIFTYLQGKVAGLQINAVSSPPSLQWRGGTPDVYLDEVHTDAEMLSSIPVNDIAYVKVFRPPFFGAPG